jgi:dCTP deaminase
MAKEFSMISPFEERQLSPRIVSFGLSSYGYDIRIADEFKILAPAQKKVVLDPKKIDKKLFVDFKGDFCLIPANSFVLGRSVEYFKIPRNVLAISVGKSSYARIGVIVNVTPLEPCWEGFLTIEITNTSPYPVKIYSNEGISQLIFFESDENCELSYSERKGRYQKQDRITLPFFKEG